VFACLTMLGGFSVQADRPNVLFIIVDDLNDYISLLEDYPGIRTPNLDRFAKTAMTFTRGYCTGPICNPSRTALLSGIAPYGSGVYDNGDSIAPLLENPQTEWTRPALTTYLQNDHAVRDSRWRYIRYHDGSEELYDHSNDPNEWTNLAGLPEYASVKSRLAQWIPEFNAEPVGRKKGRKK
jgi:arylsulfatase A-like enzyme